MSLMPVVRPNGKLYRPRKIRAEIIDNDDVANVYVVVLGTHDKESAHYYAYVEAECQYGAVEVVDPQLVWYRSSISNNEPVWIWDAGRGAAGVVFRIEEL